MVHAVAVLGKHQCGRIFDALEVHCFDFPAARIAALQPLGIFVCLSFSPARIRCSVDGPRRPVELTGSI
jgi:hypothetical protein